MAFLTGRLENDNDGDEHDLDPTEQPTEPLQLFALMDILQSRREAIKRARLAEHPPKVREDCPLCCMNREEMMSTGYVCTDGVFLWPCAFHREQITHATSAEDLEFYAQILQDAYLRYCWPPGY